LSEKPLSSSSQSRVQPTEMELKRKQGRNNYH
jgi:hypothetical protein